MQHFPRFGRAIVIGLAIGLPLVGLSYWRFMADAPAALPVASFDGETESGFSYSKIAYAEGRRAAEHDIREGKLSTESFGLPAPWTEKFDSILSERYHIGQRWGGCCVSMAEFRHAKGYNEVMDAEIKRRYGPGLLQKVAMEAAQSYQAGAGK